MKRISDKESIQIQRDILETFHRFCVEYNLKYSLAYGSLLGAVRHKDMIPWDDDIDVMMPRADFEKLCELYSEKGDKQYAVVNHRTNPEVKTRLAYFTNALTITYNIGYHKEDNVQAYGIHIDVYPVDYVPDNKLTKKLFFLKRSILFAVVRGASLHPEVRKNKVKRFLLKMIKCICAVFNQDKCIDALVKLCRKYENMPVTEDSLMSVLLEVGKPICFSYKTMENYSNYEYGEKKYCGVADYNTLLTLWYGDYMKLPPENERIPHKFSGTEYYWK